MDSTSVEFWDSRFAGGKTPWDMGRAPVALQRYLEKSTPGRVLIPGCGSAYEVQLFYQHGWHVTGIDFSPKAVEIARNRLGPLASCILQADFFAHAFAPHSFDVIYERTFLCSMPQDRWPRYVQRVRELLSAGSHLIGFFLYGGEKSPPPYPMEPVDAKKLFDGHFELMEDDDVSDSLPLFQGRERWQVRRMKPGGPIS